MTFREISRLDRTDSLTCQNYVVKPRVITLNFVELEFSMLHTKFQYPLTFGSEGKDFGITKWEITKITISQNTKRTNGKLNEQLSPRRWPLSYLNLAKYHQDTQKVKTVQRE